VNRGPTEHPRVGDHGDIGELVGSHERLQHRQHGLGLGPVPLKPLHHQRPPGGVGEQPDGDLRVQPSFLAEPRLTEPVTLIGLEVQRRDVEQHQRRRPQLSVRRARGRQTLPPRRLGIHGQSTLHRGVPGRGDADLLQHPGGVDLAGRLDDPGQHQIPEHGVPTGRGVEPERLVRGDQRVPQVAHPRRGDLQRPTRRGGLRDAEPEIQLGLPRRQPLPSGGLQRGQLLLIVRRTEMLDVLRPPPRRIHDLHRHRP